MALSIRWRLTVWNTLALAFVLLAFAVAIYGLLARALYDQLDRRLLGGLRELEQDRRLDADTAARVRHWVYELHEHEGVFAVVFGPGGEVRDRTEQLAADSVLATPPAVSGEPRLHDAAVPILGRQRVLEGQLPAGSEVLTVVLMAPLEEVDRELARLLAALATAVPVALGLSAGLGYVLARKALAPVDQLRRQTREITADRLDRRLPVVNPGDELGALARTINEMIGRLETSFAEIRRFTADASHELRTPLTAIRTETEVALTKPSVPPETQHLLGSILEECERLTRLTDQLLALSREDAGVARLARESVELTALVEGVVENMRQLAEAKGLRLHIDTRAAVRVQGDDARLRQVFYNLLDNSIKYTPEGGTVEVRVASHGGAAVVTVSDTGIGIPAEHQPRVFDRFYRVDKARSREMGGTGLGLSIVKHLAEGMGATVSVESELGRGTRFTLTVPPGLEHA